MDWCWIMCAPFHTRMMFLFTILLVRFFLLNRHSSLPFLAHTPGHLHVPRPAVLDLSTLPLADIACSSSQAPHAMNYRCACPSYTREQLLACKETAAQLDPKLISRLKVCRLVTACLATDRPVMAPENAGRFLWSSANDVPTTFFLLPPILTPPPPSLMCWPHRPVLHVLTSKTW